MRSSATALPRQRRLDWSSVLVGLLLLHGLVFGGGWWLSGYALTSPLFRVREVRVEVPLPRLKQQVRALLASWQGETYWEIRHRRRALEEQLGALPAVREVSVRTRMPNHVSVRITPRLPVAQVCISGEYFLFDEEGVIFDSALQPLPHLPVVYGLQLPTLKLKQRLVSPAARAVLRCLKAVERLRAEGKSVALRRIAVSPEGILQVRWEDGLLVRLGAPWDLEEKLDMVLKIRQVLRPPQGIEYIDVSALEVPVWKPQEG